MITVHYKHQPCIYIYSKMCCWPTKYADLAIVARVYWFRADTLVMPLNSLIMYDYCPHHRHYYFLVYTAERSAACT